MVKVKIFGILRAYCGTASCNLKNGISVGEIKSRLFGNQLDYSYIKVLLNGEHADDKTVLADTSVSLFYIGGGGFPGG
jgi:molybdopterin converting factor small subunit